MDDAAYRRTRRRVMRRLLLQITFVANVLFFILTTVAILTSPKPDAGLGVLFWALIWGTILAIHGMFAFNLFSRRIDQAVQRELEREAPREKRKHQVMEIGDDGELVDTGEEVPATLHSGKGTGAGLR
jgi:hypothetical protein